MSSTLAKSSREMDFEILSGVGVTGFSPTHTNHQYGISAFPEIDYGRLSETVELLGVNEARNFLKVTVNKIRSAISNDINFEPEFIARELHTACGRLSWLGVDAPRLHSRKFKSAVEDGCVSNLGLEEKRQLIETLTSANAELTRHLASMTCAESPQRQESPQRPEGSGVIATIASAFVSYAGALAAFLTTYSLMWTLLGFCSGLVFLLIYLIIPPRF